MMRVWVKTITMFKLIKYAIYCSEVEMDDESMCSLSYLIPIFED